LRRVALNLIDGLNCLDVNMICAALLHDAVEDTKELDIDFIEDTFGVEVARLVIQLSKVPAEGYYERLVICRDWRVLAIKLCGDNLDNMRSLWQTDGKFQRKQIGETDQKYLPLFVRLLTLAPEAYRPDIATVQQEMNAIVVGYQRQFLLEDAPPSPESVVMPGSC
jgi:(p)ppGpp synthase/HD superfamily hydrolase